MALFQTGFVSYTMRRMVNISVIVPTPLPGEGGDKQKSHKPAHPYPVLYLLHGYSGDGSVWQRFTSLERYAEERNIAVVTMSAENKFYANHPGDDRFYDFLAKELPDFVRGMFPISTRREDTYIAGLSMGGYGSLLHAFSHPQDFCAVGAFSSGLSETGIAGPADAVYADTRPDLYLMLKEYEGKMAELPKLYLSCGSDDGLLEANVKLKDQILAQGGQVAWEELPGYGHEWAFWDLQLDKFLNWIPRTYDYATAPRRHV